MEKFEHRQLLRIFEKVSRHGEHNEGVTTLSGIKVETGYDGYTICFWDANGSVVLQFHNTIASNFSNESSMYRFMSKLHAIDKDYD